MCTISGLCRYRFISLNFAGIFSIATRISTQLSMTSRNENEVECCCFQFVYRTFCEVWAMFLLKNTILGAIWEQMQSSMYLRWNCIYHFINFRKVWTLESDSFNYEILAGETALGAPSSPILHISRFFWTIIFLLIILLSPKEFSSDATPWNTIADPKNIIK